MKFQNIDSEFLPTSSSFIVKVIHRTSTLLTKNTAIKFSSITDLNVVEWRELDCSIFSEKGTRSVNNFDNEARTRGKKFAVDVLKFQRFSPLVED